MTSTIIEREKKKVNNNIANQIVNSKQQLIQNNWFIFRRSSI